MAEYMERSASVDADNAAFEADGAPMDHMHSYAFSVAAIMIAKSTKARSVESLMKRTMRTYLCVVLVNR